MREVRGAIARVDRRDVAAKRVERRALNREQDGEGEGEGEEKQHSDLQVRRPAPVLGDHGMPGGCGMDAVRGPVRRRGATRQIVERFLEPNERRSRMLRHPRCGGSPLVEFRKPAVIHRAAAEDERLENH